MKVLTRTPDLLILENRPIWLAVFLSVFGLVFVGAGIAVLTAGEWQGALFILAGLGVAVGFNMIFIRRTQVILDRPGDRVEMRRKSFFGYTRRSWDLHDLRGAHVQTSRTSKGGKTHRAVLEFTGGMDAGQHPMTLVYSSGGGAARAASAVNGWLAEGAAAPALDSARPSA